MPLGFHATMAEIDLEALVHNYYTLRQLLAPSVKVLAVVKADAYGHGAVPISRRLEELGVDFLGVAAVKEAVEIRQAGLRTPIIILSGVYPEEVEAVLHHELTPMVFRGETAEFLSAQAKKMKKTISVHLKVDTGMGRIGVHYQDVGSFVTTLRNCENLRIEGIASHFATADEEDVSFAEEQLRRFSWSLEQLGKIGVTPTFCHIANSAALFRQPAAHFNVVRPGIMLYGSYPSSVFREKISLRAVMSWKSRVADLKSVPTRFPISYGRTYVTKRPSLIAAIPVGYADGYSRLLANRGEVLIKGRRAPVVGRVCMDWTMVDVTEIPDVNVGDDVMLLGRQLNEAITAEELSERIGTIPYEVLCSVGKRVPRTYRG